MSLINQMLQDLEKRHAAAGKTAALSGEVRAVPGPASIASPVLLVSGLVLLVLVAAGGAWLYLHKTTQAPVVAVVPPVAPAPAPVPEPAVPSPVEAAVVPQASPTTRLPGLDTQLTATTPPVPPQPAVVPVAQPRAVAAPNLPAPSTAAVTQPIDPGTAGPNVASQKPVARAVSAAPVGSGKSVSAVQQSDNLYRQAIPALQQGRVAEAQESLRRALELNPRNLNARQVLVGLVVEAGHHEEASALLRDGLRLSPEQTGYSMALARLQIEAGDAGAALATLEQGQSFAGENAEFHGFYAALLQREARHEDAVQHYLTALRSDPAMPTWLVGIGISLQAQGKDVDAAAAFQRARDTGQLTPQLSQFVEQRLAQLKR